MSRRDSPPAEGASTGWALGAVFVAGLAFRLARAMLEPGIPDEEICIRMAEAATRPGGPWVLHGGDHPLLGVYLLAASGTLFGPSLFGYRLLGVLAGAATPIVLGAAVSAAASPRAGLAAAVLLAANPLHAGVSARAFELPFQLLFVSLALWALARWRLRPAQVPVLSAAAFLGLAFLCSESAALVGLAWALVLASRAEDRLRLPLRDVLCALGVFVAVIGVDLVYNLTATRSDHAYVNYLDHLNRISRPSLSLQGLGFFFRDWLNALPVGPPAWKDDRDEYPGPGYVAGPLLLAGAVLAFRRGDPTRGLWSLPPLVFVLVPTLLGPAHPGGLDVPMWTWPLPALPFAVASTAAAVAARWGTGAVLALALAGAVAVPGAASPGRARPYGLEARDERPGRPEVANDERGQRGDDEGAPETEARCQVRDGDHERGGGEREVLGLAPVRDAEDEARDEGGRRRAPHGRAGALEPGQAGHDGEGEEAPAVVARVLAPQLRGRRIAEARVAPEAEVRRIEPP
jgi:hypothetical protein